MHKKDIHVMEDRLAKVEKMLQMSIKEKNALISQSAVREKELAELVKKQTTLRANVSTICTPRFACCTSLDQHLY
jgi:hypothetical protein